MYWKISSSTIFQVMPSDKKWATEENESQQPDRSAIIWKKCKIGGKKQCTRNAYMCYIILNWAKLRIFVLFFCFLARRRLFDTHHISTNSVQCNHRNTHKIWQSESRRHICVPHILFHDAKLMRIIQVDACSFSILLLEYIFVQMKIHKNSDQTIY